MKRLKNILLIFFLINLKINSNFFVSEENMEKIGNAFFKGGINALSVSGEDFSKEFSKQFADGLMKGFAGTLKEGGAADEVTKNFGGALNRGLKFVAEDSGEGIKWATNKLGQDMQENFQKGSEIDKGFKSGVNLLTRNTNEIIQSLLHKNLIKVSGIAIGTIASYYTLKSGIPLAVKMIEKSLTRPKLIIESSKNNFLEKLKLIFSKNSYSEIIFEKKLENRLSNLVKVTTTISKKIKNGKKNIKYRNLMLYGPPGTGKTLFAKELAKRSGLEYVFMSGSSFYKFKDGEGIEALDELFAWANKSKNGLLIFIDEAETFLSKREKIDPKSKSYQLLNNFLNYTGTRSNKFMLIFATNHKDALDSAMYRRIDDLVKIPLPEAAERERILNLYKKEILMDIKQNGKIFVDSVNLILTQKLIQEIAKKTEGFSGAELQGIINTIKTDTQILDPEILTREIVDNALQEAIEKFKEFNGKKL